MNKLTAVTGADPTPPPDPGPIHFEEGEPPPPPPADTYTYDSNGNTTARIYWRGGGNTFEWDAANRLVAVNYTGTSNRTEFTYDGLGHRKKIVEKTGTTVTSTKQFVWIGNRIAEERDGNNVVARRYFANGEERIGGTGAGVYYYAKDHLGSIRELTDGAGSLRARYDYDPFGNTTKVSGDLSLDFGYTRHYRHTASNLYLAPFRAYDPAIGRWISRDPLENAEMRQGPNLYSYVGNSPINRIDLRGKFWTELIYDIFHFWEGSKCKKIALKWRKNCFEKIPQCGDCQIPPHASDYELGNAIEQAAECKRQQDLKWNECLKGMNQELLDEHCATKSL